MTIVGTRPEIIRLSRLIPTLDSVSNHILVHTGQNHDPRLSDVFFADLDLRPPDVYLEVDTSSVGSVMADVLRGTERLLAQFRPDAVMILGDTNSSIGAIICERNGVPVYHMEAGNRSFDNNVPEEMNRKLVDQISTFNLPYNEHSWHNLLREGHHPRFLLRTGSPIPEIYKHFQEKIEKSRILSELNLKTKGYFLVSLHRQENVDSESRLHRSLSALDELAKEHQVPALVSTHPRTRLRISENFHEGSNLVFHEPFGYLDYNKLQLESKCVISDSGTISEEAAVMGFPAVTMRESMERPEALEAGTISMSGLDHANLSATVSLAVSKSRQNAQVPSGYSTTSFSSTVANFVLSTYHLAASWKGLHSK